ncbi:MAG TPA: OsmC family protein [Tepidisphaeraceae bacterium]|jgi:osmotically inducible protein OsmC
MPTRNAEATWEGNLKEGKGSMKLGSGAFQGAYSFATRFEAAPGTNPEELIGAAHAGCFSMAFSAGLAKAGYQPRRVHTSAQVHLEKVGEGFGITRIQLNTDAEIPNITETEFQRLANAAKEGCPVSKALAGVKIELQAHLAK